MSGDSGGSLTAAGGYQLLEFQGTAFRTGGWFGQDQLAVFPAEGAGDSAGNYTVTIDWGDQTAPTTGVAEVHDDLPVLVPPGEPLEPASFDVAAGHTYSQAGTYTIAVTIVDGQGHSTTVDDTAVVVAGPFTLSAPPTSYPVAVGIPLTHGGLATLIAAGEIGDLGSYKATIDWGDGTAPTQGSLDQLGFIPEDFPEHNDAGVEGSHVYEQPGTYDVTVMVTDANGNLATTTTKIQVVPEVLSAGGGLVMFSTAPGSLVGASAPIAHFADSIATSTPGDFQATIDWGDGSPPIPGVIAPSNPPSSEGYATFDVLGQHAYTQAGSYTVKVTMDRPRGLSATETIIINVLDPALPPDQTTPSPSPPGVVPGPVPSPPVSQPIAPVESLSTQAPSSVAVVPIGPTILGPSSQDAIIKLFHPRLFHQPGHSSTMLVLMPLRHPLGVTHLISKGVGRTPKLVPHLGSAALRHASKIAVSK